MKNAISLRYSVFLAARLVSICFIAAIPRLEAQTPNTQLKTYQISSGKNSRLSLEVEKTGLLSGKKHLFVFPDYTGTLVFNEQAALSSQIEMHIQTKTIECLDEWVSAKDKVKVLKEAREKMLAVDQFPELVFRSETIAQAGPTRFHVSGNLVIRGVGRPVQVDVTLDQKAAERLHFVGNALVKLTDYHLKPPTALLGAIGTKNEMKVSFDLFATRE